MQLPCPSGQIWTNDPRDLFGLRGYHAGRPRVIEKMVQFLGPDGVFGNPSSTLHRQGLEANNAVEQSRQLVANLINAEPDEIIWTSGATESDNLAIKGVAQLYADRGRHIVTSEIEHKAVLDPCLYLETWASKSLT